MLFVRANQGNVGCAWFICRTVELCFIGGNMAAWEARVKELNEKRSLKSAHLGGNGNSSWGVERLFWMRPCHFFRRLAGVRLVSSLFRQCITFWIKCTIMQWVTFAEVHVERSVILIDRLGPASAVLSTFWMKEQLMHRLRAHLKIPG